jgi:hypothetical protein
MGALIRRLVVVRTNGNAILRRLSPRPRGPHIEGESLGVRPSASFAPSGR